jgi:hypothetical protein
LKLYFLHFLTDYTVGLGNFGFYLHQLYLYLLVLFGQFVVFLLFFDDLLSLFTQLFLLAFQSLLKGVEVLF